VIQKNYPLKCFLFDKDPLDCMLNLVHMSYMNFNTGKVNIVSAVSRIRTNLTEWGAILSGDSKKILSAE